MTDLGKRLHYAFRDMAVMPDEEARAAFPRLLLVLESIAAQPPSPRNMNFVEVNKRAARAELKALRNTKSLPTAALSQTTIRALARSGIDRGRLPKMEQPAIRARLKAAAVGIKGRDGRGRKTNRLARTVCLLILDAYEKATGENPRQSHERDGLAQVVREVFDICHIDADSRGALQTAIAALPDRWPDPEPESAN